LFLFHNSQQVLHDLFHEKQKRQRVSEVIVRKQKVKDALLSSFCSFQNCPIYGLKRNTGDAADLQTQQK
jgi:hypothetical protein